MAGQRRSTVRPRYGRIGAALSSVGVTTVAVLGGAGVLPSAAEAPQGAGGTIATTSSPSRHQPPAPSPAPSAQPGVDSPASTPGERVVASEVLPADSGT